MKYPALVIIAFNRPHSLTRLLSSIVRANYPDDVEVPLCICVDYQDSEENQEVVRIARSFEWAHGPKEVIHQKKNLGLKEHVLTCGDLTERFGSIIMLEDDIYVSKFFYHYAQHALSFYRGDKNIGGVSLYNRKTNFSNKYPFEPLEDGADVYFLQEASSWGQAWDKEQWQTFKGWLIENPVVPLDAFIPNYVIGWPDKSWLKHFTYFLSKENKFFVYPRVSFSTNFGDSGENTANNSLFFQVSLAVGDKKEYDFIGIKDSLAVYDSFYDLIPARLKSLNPKLEEYDFVNNLSGLKPKEKIYSKYVLSLGVIKPSIMSFGLEMKPIEMNVIFECPGEMIVLVKVQDFGEVSFNKPLERKRLFEYYRGLITPYEKINNVVDIFWVKVLNKFRRVFNFRKK